MTSDELIKAFTEVSEALELHKTLQQAVAIGFEGNTVKIAFECTDDFEAAWKAVRDAANLCNNGGS